MPFTKPQSALIIAGHGSTVSSDSSAPTFAHARTIRQQGCFGEVHCCFWKEEPGLRQVYDMVKSDDIYVVPNFISEGYFTRTVIPREMELAGPVTLRHGRRIKYCEPAGSHARMTDVLLHRAQQMPTGVEPARTSLIIAGHGTNLYDNSAEAVRTQVKKIQALTNYAEVLGAYMEEEPFIADWPRLTSMPCVVVVPFFIADGLHSRRDIPILLGMEPKETEDPWQNPHHLHGRDLFYARAIGSEPLFAGVILDQVTAFDRQHL